MTEKDQIISDDDIVKSVRDGRIQHFEVLVNRYRNRIVNFIHKMIFDYDEAHSLAQDVFVKVYESMGTYQSQNNFQAFIFTIAKNLTLNHIKKQKRFQWFSGTKESNGQEEKYFQTGGTQELDIEKQQQEMLLNEGLRQLKENQRIALILKVYLEFSYKKIADITGWSEPKIETLISRAKSSLKGFIQSQEQPGSSVKSKQKMQENTGSRVLRMRST